MTTAVIDWKSKRNYRGIASIVAWGAAKGGSFITTEWFLRIWGLGLELNASAEEIPAFDAALMI